ncbi:MAG: hypothetical protein K2M60_10870 [Lachnospiraceae bacterium]|nr:hypothetical protein [Lachnospiraceae bacterium]MDE6251772.1 hypothetical protein [Lachnospiraceae bacterium]
MNQTVRDYKALIADEIQDIDDSKFLHRVYISVRDYSKEKKENGIICSENINIPPEEPKEDY